MKISIVTTMYKSEAYIDEFCERTQETIKQIVGDEYEIILVNDGSPDNSLEIALNRLKHEPKLRVVDLSRNFGHHKAIMTGLSYARGDLIYLLDSDLEEKPEWLITFYHHMQECNCDVVYGVQKERKGGFFERWSGKLFYMVLKGLTSLSFPENITVARLMTKRYVKALLMHQEYEVFLAGLFDITGYDQRPVYVSKQSKKTTTYTLSKKVSQFVDSIVSFSIIPLVVICVIGLMITMLSIVYIFYLFINWLLVVKPPSGYTSLIASIWFVAGLLSLFIGVVGIYMAKIFSEVKKRPYTIVKQYYRGDGRKE